LTQMNADLKRLLATDGAQMHTDVRRGTGKMPVVRYAGLGAGTDDVTKIL
jgi:hypothetical protein